MRSPNLSCSRFCLAALLSLTASLISLGAHAQANPLADAQSLLQQGQQAQALERVERVLSTTPKDRQARFLKGVILTEMNRLDEAAGVFQKLTEDAPELPEPYNNLAVIYAQQKQFDKARAALEMAIRTHPSYAVAHENLGDLYAKMARQAYDRALQIDSSNSAAQAKLNLLRDLGTGGRAPQPTRPVAVAAAPTAVLPAPAKPAASSAATSVAAVAVPAAKPAPAAPTPTPAPVAQVAASSARSSAPAVAAAEKPAEKPAARQADETAVREVVHGWAAAWSSKNAKGYLGYYGPDFQVPDRKGRKAWEEERTQRVTKPGAIKVSVQDLSISIKNGEATARFKQRYESAGFNASSGKTLILTQRGGRWLIQQERIGR